MNALILTVHFIACSLLIVAVLLQSGKGSAAGIFGGGNADAIFAASSGMDFIKKFTMGCAVTIAVTSVLLTFYSTRLGSGSVVNKYRFQQPPAQSAPAAPAAPSAPAK
ncbi:MAG: preprotein translocase subunit SecG [Elusimicrobiales bacterium]